LYICVIKVNTMAIQDNKTETIIARVSADLKEALQKMADMDNRKLSDYVRLQLIKLVDNSKKKK
jgi:uncharacterized protein (DUF1778 family)